MFQKQEIKVSGTCLQKFEPVKEAFQENFNLGEELSAQLCIVYRGKIVSLRIYNMVNKKVDKSRIYIEWKWVSTLETKMSQVTKDVDTSTCLY